MLTNPRTVFTVCAAGQTIQNDTTAGTGRAIAKQSHHVHVLDPAWLQELAEAYASPSVFASRLESGFPQSRKEMDRT